MRDRVARLSPHRRLNVRQQAVRAAALLASVTSALVLVSCRGSARPIEPSPIVSAPPLVSRILAGRAVDILDELRPVAGVSVEIPGTARVTTDSDGGFEFSVPASSTVYTLHFYRDGFVERHTFGTIGAAPKTFSLIPSSFDLAAFEEFAPRTSGLRRWTSNPTLTVEQSIIDFATASNGFTDFIATDRTVPPGEMECIVSGIRDSLGPMTGDQLRFEAVRVEAPLAGGSRVLTMSTAEGTILVLPATHLGSNGRGIAYEGSVEGVLVRGVVFIDTDALPHCGQTAARTYPHELGHSLGYAPHHVTLAPSIMGSPPTAVVSDFDRAAIQVVYGRNPGNVSPDSDPRDSSDGMSALTHNYHTEPIPD